LLKQCSSKGDKYVIDEELQHADHLFLGVACFTFLNFVVKDKKIHKAIAFNFTYRYIDDVLSINNYRFAEFLPLIYPPELEVKETTDTASSASFLDLYDSGQLSTGIYFDKILVSEYKLLKGSNKANLFIALFQ
jgi:hypothetical protein